MFGYLDHLRRLEEIVTEFFAWAAHFGNEIRE
jgi:hypothetical protein